MKPPLHIHLVWHPDFTEGIDYARLVYSRFARNTEQLFGSAIGIPVFFHSLLTKHDSAHSPLGINLSAASQHCIVILADAKMALSINEWRAEMNNLLVIPGTKNNLRIVPTAFSSVVMNKLSPYFGKLNWARIYDGEAAGGMKEFLILLLGHELCKQLYRNDMAFSADPEGKIKPIRLFLSHSKKDGLQITQKIKEHVEKYAALDVFFDANSISPGDDFAEELNEAFCNPEQQKQKSTLLVIQTDYFSTREWCRFEVLTAKKYNCPAIVIDAIQQGESRSFPYMANVPTIRWNIEDENNAGVVLKILSTTMVETLRIKFKEQFLDYCISELKLVEKEVISLGNAPELLDLINHRSKFNPGKTVMVYPDPPLCSNELKLLEQFTDNLTIRTPLQLVADLNKNQHPISIGISISGKVDLFQSGLSSHHLNDAMIELARYLLASGYQLAYGGDLTFKATSEEFNFAELMKEIIINYCTDFKKKKVVKNYAAYPRYKQISDDQMLGLVNIVELVMLPRPDGLTVSDKDYKKLIQPITPEEKFDSALCLTDMRKEMNDNIEARILLGGKVTGYQGKYPGLVEEALLAMQSDKSIALYLLGGFGGCAGAIADAVRGNQPRELTEEYQFKDAGYKAFCDYYNTRAEPENKIQYESVMKYFNENGTNHLRNGLTNEENKILFETTDVMEMIKLVLKGLNAVQH